MIGAVVTFVCCLFCAFPFIIVAKYDRNSMEPIGFWTGDKSLKGKVKEVKLYNEEMAKVYSYCAWAFFITGIVSFVSTKLAFACIFLDCTVGIYFVWKKYKSILAKYS